MKKRSKKRSRDKADVMTRASVRAINAAEKGLSKAVMTGLDALEGVLKAVNPFTK